MSNEVTVSMKGLGRIATNPNDAFLCFKDGYGDSKTPVHVSLQGTGVRFGYLSYEDLRNLKNLINRALENAPVAKTIELKKDEWEALKKSGSTDCIHAIKLIQRQL